MISAPVLQEMLRDLITKYGPPNDSNSQIFYSELKKSLADEPREKGLLELSLYYNIPGRLYVNQNNPDIIDNLIQELISQYQVDKHAAEWIVKTWAKSMGMYVAPYQPPNTSEKSQSGSQQTKKIENQSREGDIKKQVTGNGSHSVSSVIPPQGNTNQKQYQQSAKTNGKNINNKSFSISEYFPIIGVIVVLLVIAAIMSGLSGESSDNTGHNDEVENYETFSEYQIAGEKTPSISDQNEENTGGFSAFDLSDENPIVSENGDDDNQKSNADFIEKTSVNAQKIEIDEEKIPDGNLIWTYTTEHDLSKDGYCVLSNDIACFAMNGPPKSGEKGTIDSYLLAIDTLNGKFLWEKNFGGCKVEPSVLNGVIYFNEMPNFFTAYDAQTGKKIWTIENDLMGGNRKNFEIFNDLIYLWTKYNQVSIIDPLSGQEMSIINFKLLEPISPWGGSRDTLGVSQDTIVILKDLNDLMGFDLSSGDQKWKIESDPNPIFSNDIIYYGMTETLNGIDTKYLCASEISTGKLKWQEKMDKSFYIDDESLVSDNLLYIFSDLNSELNVFDPSNGQLKWNLKDYLGRLKITKNTLIGNKGSHCEGLDKTTGDIKWENNADLNLIYYLGENNGLVYFFKSHDGFHILYALDSSSGNIDWIHKFNPTEIYHLTVMDNKGVLFVQQNKDTGEYIVYGIV